jgi:flagellar motor component MotA
MARMPNDPVEAVITLVQLARKARDRGRASLMEDAEHADNAELRDGLRLVAEGRPLEEVKAALGRQVTEATANQGTNEPVRRMVEAGILAIHEGASPGEVRERLLPFLTPEEQDRLLRLATGA